MGKREWVSKDSVTPVKKDIFNSGLEAMLSFDVQVYFVDEKTFREIDASVDHGNEILRKSLSENKKLGRNFLELPTLSI